MARLGNTPLRQVNFFLDRGKSFAYNVTFEDLQGNPYDLTGCEVRVVVESPEHWGGDEVIQSVAVLIDAAGGVSQFRHQASDLYLEPGEYPYDVTFLSASGYSVPVTKGLYVIGSNTDDDATNSYPGVLTPQGLTAIMHNGATVKVCLDYPDGPKGDTGDKGDKGDPTGIFVQPEPPAPDVLPPYLRLWVDTDEDYRPSGYVWEDPELPPDLPTGIIYFDPDETNIPTYGTGVVYVKAYSGELVPITRHNGPPGTRGSWWWTGTTDPPVISDAQEHDLYLDLATGDVWAFAEPESTLGYGFGSYGAGAYGGSN